MLDQKKISSNKIRLTKKKKNNNLQNYAKIYIRANLNNTILTATSNNGNTLAWKSAGCVAGKNKKGRHTGKCAKIAGYDLGRLLYSRGITNVDIIIKGVGLGLRSALRGCVNSGLFVRSLINKTYLPFNGCRPPKKNRHLKILLNNVRF